MLDSTRWKVHFQIAPKSNQCITSRFFLCYAIFYCQTIELSSPIGEPKESGAHAYCCDFRILPLLVSRLYPSNVENNRRQECPPVGHPRGENHFFTNEFFFCLFPPNHLLLYEQEFSQGFHTSFPLPRRKNWNATRLCNVEK